MIYTVTVNPALDVTLVCQEPVTPATVRPEEEWRHAGGKGIDVSRVIRNLGGASVAMGVLGGFTGRDIEGRLLQDGLEIDFVHIGQETRTNVIIITPGLNNCAQRITYRYNAPGPEPQSIEYLELLNRIGALETAGQQRRPTYAAICGSLPGKMNVLSYVSTIRAFKKMGAVTALDTSGSALKESMRYEPRPDIIKPNIAEFNELIDDRLMPGEPKGASRPVKEEYLRKQSGLSCGVGCQESQDEFWKLLLTEVSEFRNKYEDLQAVMLSLGTAGILLMLRKSIYHGRLETALNQCPDSKCKFVSPIGAGDAVLAALIFERDRGKSWEDALRLSVAAGAAAVTKPGTEAPSREEIDHILERHRVNIHEH